VAAASVAATGLIITSFLASRSNAFYRREQSAAPLIVLLCACDAAYNCAWLVKAGTDAACRGQAIAMEFFGLASLCWTIAIAVHVSAPWILILALLF